MAENPRITYESIVSMSDYILSKIPGKPKIGILCGTGLDGLADPIEDKVEIQYKELPDFPECHVIENESCLIFGKLSGVPVIYFKGRLHVYEGYSLDKIVLPVRLMKLLEVRTIILTDVAGAVNKEYAIGDIMLFKDHINFVGFNGTSPLKDADERWGGIPSVVYDKELRDKAKKFFEVRGFEGKVHEGVYVCLGGPKSETIAEVNMMKLLGGDAIGMSTVHEVLAAMQCDIKVVAWSMITHIAATDYDSEVTVPDISVTQEHLEALQQATEDFIKELEPPPPPPPPTPPPEPVEPQKKTKPCACKRVADDACMKNASVSKQNVNASKNNVEAVNEEEIAVENAVDEA